MHFMYVDESGDPGEHGSDYFIVTGLLIPTATWREVEGRYRSLRKSLNNDFGLPFYAELHGVELAGTRGKVGGLSLTRKQRRQMFKVCLHAIGGMDVLGVRTFSVRLNKGQTYARKWKDPAVVLNEVFKWHFQRFSTFLKTRNDRLEKACSKVPDSLDDESFELLSGVRTGAIFVDQTNVHALRRAVATLREGDRIPSDFGHTYTVRDFFLIEEPVMMDSKMSPFVQMTDLVATALKAQYHPNRYQRDHKLDELFESLLRPIMLSEAARDDPKKQGIYTFP